MKVLIDTNVFLSYLLAPITQRVVTTVVDTCFTHEEIDLIIPSEQISEFSTKATTKRYFSKRIPRTVVEQFVAQLTWLAEQPSPLENFATYSRDPKDDYLVAYGIINEVDFLITGDADLLVLAAVERLTILKPGDFLRILHTQKFLP